MSYRHVVRYLELATAVLISGLAACSTQRESQPVQSKESQVEVATRDITSVMNDHVNELMAIPGVTGVAISELEDKTPCILVMIVEESPEVRKQIPERIEGHPVKVTVSGEIRPLDGRQ